MFHRANLRLLVALGPSLVLGTIAVALAADLDPVSLRFTLLLLAVGSVASMSWRVGAAALGGTLTRAHGLPHRLKSIANDTRRPTFDRETGLHAEWYFRLRADEEIARSKRYNQPFTILRIGAKSRSELDAPRVAMTDWLREVDFAGDLGNTLAICLPNTSRSGAWPVIARLTEITQGVDVIVTEYPADGSTLSALLQEDAWTGTGIHDVAA
jgi:hypothetical protein